MRLETRTFSDLRQNQNVLDEAILTCTENVEIKTITSFP